MSADLNTSLVIRLGGNLAQKAHEYGDALAKMGERGSGAMQGLKTITQQVAEAAETLGSKWTALVGVIGGIAGAKHLADIQWRMDQIGNRTGTSLERMSAFRKEVINTAEKSRAPLAELMDGFEEIALRTGSPDIARGMLPLLGDALLVTGEKGKTLGGVFTALRQQWGLTGVDLVQGFQMLRQAELPLDQFEGMTRAAVRLGRTGMPGLKEQLGVAGAVRRQTSDLKVYQERVEAVQAALSPEKLTELWEKHGVQVFDPAGGFKAPGAIIEEILRSAHNNKFLLRQAFGGVAQEAFLGFAEEAEQGKLILPKPAIDPGRLGREAEAMRGRLKAIGNQAESTAEKVLDTLGEPMLRGLAGAWNGLGTGLQATALGLVAVAGAVTAGAGAWAVLKGLLGKRGSLGGGAGGLANVAGVVPVWVTNWGGTRDISSMPPGAGGGAAGAGGAAAAGAAGWRAALLGKLLAAGLIDFALWQVWSAALKEERGRASDLERFGVTEGEMRFGRHWFERPGGAPEAPARLEGLIEFRFQNAPHDLKVTRLRSGTPGVDLEVYMGQQLQEATP